MTYDVLGNYDAELRALVPSRRSLLSGFRFLLGQTVGEGFRLLTRDASALGAVRLTDIKPCLRRVDRFGSGKRQAPS